MKKLMYFLLLAFLLPIVFSDTPSRFSDNSILGNIPAATHYWPLNGSCDDLILSKSCTINGLTQKSDNPFGVTDYSYFADGTNDFIDLNFDQLWLDGAFTISFWMKRNGTVAANQYYLGVDDTDTLFYLYFMDTTQTERFYIRDGSNRADSIEAKTPPAAITNTSWQNVVLVHTSGFGSGHMSIFVNGINVTNGYLKQEGARAEHPTLDLFMMASNNQGGGATGFLRGFITDLVIWNTTALTQTQILTLNNSNYTYAIAVDIVEPKNNIILGIQNLTDNNQNIFINVTQDYISTTQCSINDSRFTEIAAYPPYNFSYVNNTYLASGNYSVKVNCTNGLNIGEDTQVFAIDVTNPVIDGDSGFDTGTKTAPNYYLTGNINFTDDRDIFDINVTFGNGTILFNKSHMNTTHYELNITNYIISSDTINITAIVCDSHTANKINDINFRPAFNGIEFMFNPTTYIQVYPKNQIEYQNPTASRSSDRYSFEFNKIGSTDAAETFIVQSSHKIDIVGNNKYKGHLVIKGIRQGYWLDFENPEVTDYAIKRLSDTVVEVTLYGLKSSKISFNSIGELNCINQTWDLQTYELYGNATYSNFILYSGVNYTRNLTYDYLYTCNSSISAQLHFMANMTKINTHAIICNNTYNHVSGTYNPNDGFFAATFYFNVSTYPADSFYNGSYNFMGDRSNPTIINLNISGNTSFADPAINITIQCDDNVSPIIENNMTFNGRSIVLVNRTPLYVQSNQTNISNGANILRGGCYDFFGKTEQQKTFSVYTKEIFLIDEKKNTLLNVAGVNFTTLKIYFDDNRTAYDFKANNRNSINFTSIDETKLRFEMEYPNGDIITRFVDVSLGGIELRLCANNETVTYYEQLIVSATIKPVTVKNVYADCIIAEDYTRFVYQDSYVLKAFTIDSLYYLYTYSGGQLTYLASMDGGLSTYYNLDVLEFSQTPYNLNINGEVLSFTKSGQTINIVYLNQRNDSTMTNITIMEENSSTIYLRTSNTISPNDFNLYWDYSTLGLANDTLMSIKLEKATATGTETLYRYFNLNGNNGILDSKLAMMWAILITFFGLTFTITRAVLGWFGIIMIFGAIAVLSAAVSTWYITFMMAMEFIILIYLVITLVRQTSPAVA